MSIRFGGVGRDCKDVHFSPRSVPIFFNERQALEPHNGPGTWVVGAGTFGRARAESAEPWHCREIRIASQ